MKVVLLYDLRYYAFLLFFVELTSYLYIMTIIDRDRFSVFRVDHRVQKSGHLWTRCICVFVCLFTAFVLLPRHRNRSADIVTWKNDKTIRSIFPVIARDSLLHTAQ
jgi:hypothetical protein